MKHILLYLIYIKICKSNPSVTGTKYVYLLGNKILVKHIFLLLPSIVLYCTKEILGYYVGYPLQLMI